jgi:hypothetical protein
MYKKHFIELADLIKAYNKRNEGIAELQFSEEQISELAFFCKRQNSNFNRERWLGYIAGECGPNGGAVKKAA